MPDLTHRVRQYLEDNHPTGEQLDYNSVLTQTCGRYLALLEQEVLASIPEESLIRFKKHCRSLGQKPIASMVWSVTAGASFSEGVAQLAAQTNPAEVDQNSHLSFLAGLANYFHAMFDFIIDETAERDEILDIYAPEKMKLWALSGEFQTLNSRELSPLANCLSYFYDKYISESRQAWASSGNEQEALEIWAHNLYELHVAQHASVFRTTEKPAAAAAREAILSTHYGFLMLASGFVKQTPE
ncbi:MAG: hypothetical protein AAF387_19950, partial [Pseudomonadota bacterium]